MRDFFTARTRGLLQDLRGDFFTARGLLQDLGDFFTARELLQDLRDFSTARTRGSPGLEGTSSQPGDFSRDSFTARALQDLGNFSTARGLLQHLSMALELSEILVTAPLTVTCTHPTPCHRGGFLDLGEWGLYPPTAPANGARTTGVGSNARY